MSETIDWTRRPHLKVVHDTGRALSLTFWSASGDGPTPRVGDRLLLLNRDTARSARYRVLSVQQWSGEGDVMNADVLFDPRGPAEVKADAERFGLDEGRIPYRPTRPVF